MKHAPNKKYLQKAVLLSRDEAEQYYSRMGKKLRRKLDESKLIPVEVLAVQLEIEDGRLKKWRKRFVAINARAEKA